MLKRYLAVLFFPAIFFALFLFRWPFLGQPPFGEENYLYLISRASYQGYDFDPRPILGRLHDHILRGTSGGHPSGFFLVFHLLGGFAKRLNVPLNKLVFFLRFTLASLFCGASGLAATSLIQSAQNKVGTFLLLVLSLSTLFLVGCSIQFQRDGCLGVLPYVLFAALMYSRWPHSDHSKLEITSAMGFASCSALMAFDKPERVALWLVSRLAAEWFIYSRTSLKPKYIYFEILGFILGYAVELSFDFSAWWNSFDVAHNVAGATRPSLWTYLYSLTPYFSLGIVALFLLGLNRFHRRLKDPVVYDCATVMDVTAIVFCGLTAIAAFSLRWLGDGFPRYFSPTLVLLSLVSIRNIELNSTKRSQSLVLLALITVLTLRSGRDLLKRQNSSINSEFGRRLSFVCQKQPESGTDCFKIIAPECAASEKYSSWIFSLDATTEDAISSWEKNLRLKACAVHPVP